MRSKRILAPINLAKPAEDDIRYALHIARAFRADLHLLYVGHSSSPGLTQGWPVDALRYGETEVEVHCAVRTGPVAFTIARHAEELDADLVFLRSRRYGSWKRFFRSSVTDELMGLSRRPVGVAPAISITDLPIPGDRLVCLVGLDGKEAMLVRYATDLAIARGAELVLTHIVPESSEALLFHAADGGLRPLSKERAGKQLLNLTRGLPVPVKMSLWVGDVAAGVRRTVREHSADLVLAARSHSGVTAVYGNDLDWLAGTVGCPLVTVPVDNHLGAPLMDGIHRRVHAPDHQMDEVAVGA
ncbi:MAG: universal stress protein [Bryobacterales bacterium]|nr:universal stress protein [Bryobacterales bacterium]